MITAIRAGAFGGGGGWRPGWADGRTGAIQPPPPGGGGGLVPSSARPAPGLAGCGGPGPGALIGVGGR